jgi:1-acyl-sn-glycerol-3-phosphate acyltransferase
LGRAGIARRMRLTRPRETVSREHGEARMKTQTTHAAVGIYSYAEFGVCLLGFLPVLAVSAGLHRDDPTQRAPGRWLRRLARTTTRLTPLWRFTIEGEPPPDIDHRGYVVAANHESSADPFLLSWLPWDMRWVAKEDLFRPPLTGWAMRLGGDIPLRRGDKDSVAAMMRECRRALDAGISIMIFPEGTRSSSGELGAFKDGAFELAIEAQAPILPIAIAGTRRMRPKHSKWFGKAHACARVLPSIATTGLAASDLASLRDRCRETIAKALPALRAEYEREG